MADHRARRYPGRLIAIDGTRGKDVERGAADVAAALKARGIECAVSRWDASGLFTDLAAGIAEEGRVSARSLSLVYAADLAFRLRWEIRPVLEAGGVVIAAPYVDTGVTFAALCGLDGEWMTALLRFAPPPNYRGLASERKVDRPWKRRLDRGYAEYGASMLAEASPKCVSKSARRSMIAALDRGRGRTVHRLTEKGVAALCRSIRTRRSA